MEYLETFDRREGIDLQDMYPGCPPEGISLLKRMIRFNPYQRITVYEALRHPFFAPIRKEEDERSTEPVVMEFELKTGELEMNELKAELLKEVDLLRTFPADEAE